MISLLRKLHERYGVSIFVGLFLMGYSFAEWFHISTSTIYVFIILILLLTGMLFHNMITIVAIPFIGILIQNQSSGILNTIDICWIEKIQMWIAAQLQHHYFDTSLQSLCNALILGDTTQLGHQQKLLFKELSIVHVIAISGMHLHVIRFYLNILLHFAFKKSSANELIAILFIWIFALIANSNPSVIRACAQFHYVSIARIKHRRVIGVNKIAVSILFIIILSPQMLHNMGLQLSIAAIIGIQFIYPLLLKGLRFENNLIRKVWQSICISLSAQIMCMPLIAYYTGNVYTQFLITNLLISPLFTLLLHLVIVFLITSGVPIIQQLIALSLVKTHQFINSVSHQLFQKLPHQAIKVSVNPFLLIYLYSAYLICIIWIQEKKPKMLVLLLLLTCLLRISQCAQVGIK
jgi:competence protein ComEC